MIGLYILMLLMYAALFGLYIFSKASANAISKLSSSVSYICNILSANVSAIKDISVQNEGIIKFFSILDKQHEDLNNAIAFAYNNVCGCAMNAQETARSQIDRTAQTILAEMHGSYSDVYEQFNYCRQELGALQIKLKRNEALRSAGRSGRCWKRLAM